MGIRHDRIRELIRSRGLTCRQVGNQAGIRVQTVYDLQAGKVQGMTVDTLLKLCRFFGVEPGYLVEVDKEGRTSPAAAR